MSKVIAVTGKGGTGKTMLSALMVRLLGRETGAKVLAIDADSSISLPYALGMAVGKTLSETRTEITEDPTARKGAMDRHVRALLRYGIQSLSDEFDVTVVDGEAGPEQINRRALESIDTLVILTDTSIRGFQTASVIQGIAGVRTGARLGQKGLVINRLKENSQPVDERARELGLEVFGHIPEDENITEYDAAGKPMVDLPDTSPSVEAVRGILKRMGLWGS